MRRFRNRREPVETGGRPVPRSRQAITYGSRYYIEIHFNLSLGVFMSEDKLHPVHAEITRETLKPSRLPSTDSGYPEGQAPSKTARDEFRSAGWS